MEAWLIFIGVLVLIGFIASGYISRQLSDKDTHNIQSHGISPGSTQSSMPRRQYEPKPRIQHERVSPPDPFAEGQKKPKKKPKRMFENQRDIKRAMILNEILKRKTE